MKDKRNECEFIEDFFHQGILNNWLEDRFKGDNSFFNKVVADLKMDLGSHPFDVMKTQSFVSFAKEKNLATVEDVKNYYFKTVNELPEVLRSSLKGIEKPFKVIDVDASEQKQARLNCEFIEDFFANKKLNKWMMKQYGDGNGFGKIIHNIAVHVDYHPFDIIKIKQFEALAECHNLKSLDDISGFYEKQSSMCSPEEKTINNQKVEVVSKNKP